MKLNFTLFTLVELFENRIKKKKSNQMICKDLSKALNVPLEKFQYLNDCLSNKPEPLPIDKDMSFSMNVDEDFDKKILTLGINLKSDLISTLPIEMLASMHMRENFKGLPVLNDTLLKSALDCDFKCSEDVDKAWKSALTERFYNGERQSYDDYVIVPQIIKNKDKFSEAYSWLISSSGFLDAVAGKYVAQFDGEEHHIEMLNCLQNVNFDGLFTDDVVAVIKGQEIYCSFVEIEGKTQFNGYTRRSVSSFSDLEIPDIQMTLTEAFGNLKVSNSNIRSISKVSISFERELTYNEREGLKDFFNTMLTSWKSSDEILSYAKSLTSKLEIQKNIEKTQYSGENTTESNFKL